MPITVGLAVEAYHLSKMQENLCAEYQMCLKARNKRVMRTILKALDHTDDQLDKLRSIAHA